MPKIIMGAFYGTTNFIQYITAFKCDLKLVVPLVDLAGSAKVKLLSYFTIEIAPVGMFINVYERIKSLF